MATAAQLAALAAVVPAAQASMRRWGVPASVTLAQWQLESGWGSSQLSTRANNFFGIKASHLGVPETYVEFPTAEYQDGKRVVVEALFERYASPADCFDDHGRLLATASRYRIAMEFRGDPMRFALELQRAYYSSSPTYASDLARQILAYKLTQYDITPPGEPAEAAQEKAA